MGSNRSHRLIDTFQKYFGSSLDEQLTPQSTPEYAALNLFHKAAARVPAYARFLDERGINPGSIGTIDDFRLLPAITKDNYIQQHPLADLCWNGELGDFIAVSSGSTGEPTYWPRFQSDELNTTTRFEQVFHDSFRADERNTLAVICFALGTWVGGMYTTASCRHLAAKGYRITIVTPGNNKNEILRVVGDLAPQFEQTVLLGYPPFLKDVIDSGILSGLDWKPLRIKLVTAGEVFSEEWRNLIGERTGSDDELHDSASLYGTADAGVIGNETPLSICIRRYLASNPENAKSLFGESRLPTLVQYDPTSRYFEVQEGRLLITGDSGVPLVRYNILDSGGVIPFDEMLAFLSARSFDPRAELAGSRGVRPMPFVYVFGRSHFAVSYFGANIYPENVMVGLEQRGIREWVTGKFVLEVKHDADENPFLSVTVEMATGEEPSERRAKAAAASIRTQLERLNSEFANYAPAEYRTPKITLLPTGEPEWFPVGVKHRYTRA